MTGYYNAYDKGDEGTKVAVLPSSIFTRTVTLAASGVAAQVLLEANPGRVSATVISGDAITGNMYQASDVALNGITVNASGGGTAAVTTSGEWWIVPSAQAGTFTIVETIA